MHRSTPMDIITSDNKMVAKMEQLGLLNDTGGDWMTLLSADSVSLGSIDHPAADAARLLLGLSE